jgi:hypothetical protein
MTALRPASSSLCLLRNTLPLSARARNYLSRCDRPSVLRALSQTCHTLRRIFLPLLWERFEACAWHYVVQACFSDTGSEERRTASKARSCCSCSVWSTVLCSRQRNKPSDFTRIANIIISRCSQNTVLPAFARCLSQLPNPRTLQFIHIHSVMSTTLIRSFRGLELPAVHTIVLPAHAHHVLRCCPKVRSTTCIEDDSIIQYDKLVTALREKCRKVEVLKGFPLIPRLWKH